MKFWKKNIFHSIISKKKNFSIQEKAFQKQIEILIGYKPISIEIFHECFTHTSLNSDDKNFERLEFLGDSIISTVVSDFLFHKAPNKDEGYLTQMRSKMVNRSALNLLGKKLNLSTYLNKRKNTNLGKNIEGNLYESLVGAIYVDKGFIFSKKFIERTLINTDDLINLENKITSYKSYILEWAQKNKFNITFETSQEDNAENILIFDSVIKLNDQIISKGRASSKKSAEEIASKRAYYKLNNKINKL